ncbi:penicillin-binding protein 4 [Clostridium sp. CAG:440]|jgi:penicillin-binding protein 3|nr:penicillin-binding protein 4 [Clostridium sp. CAG:440]
MKNKKGLIIGLVILLVMVIIIVTVITLNLNKENPEDVLNTYIAYINDKNYDGMYELLSSSSKSSISKEDFITKNKNIYEGIDSLDIKIDIKETKKESKNIKILYNEQMYTSAGKVDFSNSVNLVKEDKQYKIDWSTTLIFPELKEGYKVRVKTLKANRGAILDRDGNKLAYDGKVSSVGIVPGKLGDNKDESISKISELTGVSIETINKYLSARLCKR